MTTEPTDAELDAVLCKHWPAFSMQATLVRMWVRAAMRDAIAKWDTPPAEQQAQPGAVYAELPAPTASIGTDDAWHEAAMRDFADRTHAARLRCKSEQARLATLWGYVRADAAPKAAPAPLSDDVVKDAARWRMAALIGNEVMLHPEDRTQAAAVKAYMDATHSGLDLTGAVDAALAAQGGEDA